MAELFSEFERFNYEPVGIVLRDMRRGVVSDEELGASIKYFSDLWKVSVGRVRTVISLIEDGRFFDGFKHRRDTGGRKRACQQIADYCKRFRIGKGRIERIFDEVPLPEGVCKSWLWKSSAEVYVPEVNGYDGVRKELHSRIDEVPGKKLGEIGELVNRILEE